jgi:hypothetical protein
LVIPLAQSPIPSDSAGCLQHLAQGAFTISIRVGERNGDFATVRNCTTIAEPLKRLSSPSRSETAEHRQFEHLPTVCLKHQYKPHDKKQKPKPGKQRANISHVSIGIRK